jgi:hypothetical protein
MYQPIDLRTGQQRSPHDVLGGVKLLARLVDRGRATLTGTLGRYIFFDCQLDRVFFDAIHVSQDQFLRMLKGEYLSAVAYNANSLADPREALESEPEISDDTFMAHAQDSDVDNAAVRWLCDHLRTPSSVLSAISARVDSLPREAFTDWAPGD